MKIRYAVNCNIHGTRSKSWDGMAVFVPGPAPTKKKRIFHGCPHCSKELRGMRKPLDQNDMEVQVCT